jgi:hypothetical protein
MKWNLILIYLIIFFNILYSNTLNIKLNNNKSDKEKQDKNQYWETRFIPFDGNNIKLITLKSLDTSNADQILEMINRSFYTLNPFKIKSEAASIIKKDDLIVINEKLLFWFSATSKNERITKTGGGLLAGIYEIEKKDNKISLKPKDKQTFYTPNLLLTSSNPGIKLFSSDIFGAYKTKKGINAWGIENSKDLKEGINMGYEINLTDNNSPYSKNGIFIHFEGYVTNQRKIKGFENNYDTDPREGIIGKTKYNLIYRIPIDKYEIIQEIKFTAEKNNFGPISSAYMALYLPGYKDKNMSWVSNPKLKQIDNKNKDNDEYKLNLNKYTINKYFRNSSVRKLYFYSIESKYIKGKKYSAITEKGKGRVLCLGSPKNKINYICGYPTNNYIPKEAYKEYSLDLSENYMIEKVGKFHSLTYKLFSTPNQKFTLEEGNSFSMIMRYKIIDASNSRAANE